MRKLLLFLVASFFILLLWNPLLAQEMPQRVATIYEGPTDTTVDWTTFGNEKYLGVVYKFHEKGKGVFTRKYIIYVMDLATQRVVFRKDMSISVKKEGVSVPKIYGDLLIYLLYNRENSSVTIKKINLKTRKYLEKAIPSCSFIVWGNNKIYLISERRKRLYICGYDLKRINSYTIPEGITPTQKIIGDTAFLFYDEGDYKYGNVKTRKIVTLTENFTKWKRPSYFIPGTPIFFVLGYKDGWKMKLYDKDGNLISTYPISDFRIRNFSDTSSHIKVSEIATSLFMSIFEIEVSGEGVSTYSYLFFNNNGYPIKKLLNQEGKVSIAKMIGDTKVLLLLKSKKEKNKWKVKGPSSEFFINFGYPFIGKVTEDELIIENKRDIIERYSLKSGRLEGLYMFPTKNQTKYGGKYNNKIYVVSSSLLLTSNDKKRYLYIESFPADSPGWLPVTVSFSPTTEAPDELYEDTETKVKLSGTYSYSFETVGGIRISTNIGKLITQGEEYIWRTPKIETSQKEGVLTLKLGPITKTYPVKIIKPENPLTLTVRKDTTNHNKWKFSVIADIENKENIELRGLKWNVTIQGLKDIYKWVPKSIGPKHHRSFEIEGLTCAKDINVKWDGYTVFRKVSFTCDYKWGHIEKEISSDLEILPKYHFKIQVVGEKGGKREITPEDLKSLKIYTEDGEEITEKLTISLIDIRRDIDENGETKIKSGYGIKVSGISPGFSENPLYLIVEYMGEKKGIDLYFDNLYRKNPYTPPTLKFRQK